MDAPSLLRLPRFVHTKQYVIFVELSACGNGRMLGAIWVNW